EARQKSGFFARYGRVKPILLIVSTALTLASIGLLCHIWFWDFEDSPSLLRSKLALSERTSLAVTIISAVIRTCLAFQLGLLCVMAASIAFNKKVVTLKD